MCNHVKFTSSTLQCSIPENSTFQSLVWDPQFLNLSCLKTIFTDFLAVFGKKEYVIKNTYYFLKFGILFFEKSGKGGKCLACLSHWAKSIIDLLRLRQLHAFILSPYFKIQNDVQILEAFFMSFKQQMQSVWHMKSYEEELDRPKRLLHGLSLCPQQD